MSIRLFLLSLLALASSAIAQLIPPPPADAQPVPPSTPAPSAPPEVRAVRLSLSAGDALSSSSKTADTMKRLRAIGFNTVYISAWNNGYTLFPSHALAKAASVDRDPSLPNLAQLPPLPNEKKSPKVEARDLLADAVLEAHRQGLLAIAWFQGGFLASAKDANSHLKRLKPEWLSADTAANATAPDGSTWLNPLHPDAQKLLLDIILEAVEKYDLDGIQLDEAFAFPSPTLGYDSFTKKAFADEHMGQDPPTDPTHPAWLDWRAKKSADFLARITDEVAKLRPNFVLSLSSPLDPNSPIAGLAPLASWSKDPRWTEFVLNAQSLQPSQVEKLLPTARAALLDRANSSILAFRPDPKSLPWDDVKKLVALARAANIGQLIDLQSASLTELESNLAPLYDVPHAGLAPHPRFPRDFRPEPTKLRMNSYLGPMDSRIWRVLKPVPGDYLVSGLYNSERRILTNLVITTATPRKAYEVATPKFYDDVEIIPDRRPSKVPRKP